MSKKSNNNNSSDAPSTPTSTTTTSTSIITTTTAVRWIDSLVKSIPLFEEDNPVESFNIIISAAQHAGMTSDVNTVRYIVINCFTATQRDKMGFIFGTCDTFDKLRTLVNVTWPLGALLDNWMRERMLLFRSCPGVGQLGVWAGKLRALNRKVGSLNGEPFLIKEIIMSCSPDVQFRLAAFSTSSSTWHEFLPVLEHLDRTSSQASPQVAAPALDEDADDDVFFAANRHHTPHYRGRSHGPFRGRGGRGGKSDVVCYHCGAKGHLSNDPACPHYSFHGGTSAGSFYAVKVGRKVGVFTSWDVAKASVDGYSGAHYKRFPTRAQADSFMAAGDGPSDSFVADATDDEINGNYYEGLVSCPAQAGVAKCKVVANALVGGHSVLCLVDSGSDITMAHSLFFPPGTTSLLPAKNIRGIGGSISLAKGGTISVVIGGYTWQG